MLKAPFPTTTTVGLSSIATALAPMQHGVIGYTQWTPDLVRVINMLQWADKWERVNYDTTGLLPAPNLWPKCGAPSGALATVEIESGSEEPHQPTRSSNAFAIGPTKHLGTIG